MKKLAFVSLFSVLLACASGCNSLAYRFASPEVKKDFGATPGPYPAARHDGKGIAECLWGLVGPDPEARVWAGAFLTILLVCFPLDFVVDTLCLPYDVFQIAKDDETSQRRPW